MKFIHIFVHLVIKVVRRGVKHCFIVNEEGLKQMKKPNAKNLNYENLRYLRSLRYHIIYLQQTIYNYRRIKNHYHINLDKVREELAQSKMERDNFYRSLGYHK